jgi:hypothetical protein
MSIIPITAATGKTIDGNSGISVSAFIVTLPVFDLTSIPLHVPVALARLVTEPTSRSA